MTEQSPSVRSTRSARAAVPASVWACGPGPINPAEAWPAALLARAVGEFTDPGDRVLLVQWPVPPRPPKIRSRRTRPIPARRWR